ncbi:MAG: hypothetical protein CMH32_04700 [Micavibrio sp.]|nr:hypothetical protein [Micavibrio sp.]HCK33148.1 complex I NDUFA9 subunit family protein [Rhodospirillaceae bacterium]|tara:strand:- start:660 stop:1610 length:951 start_codon:yes stop_codon:yes gene_type:complete
MTKRQKVATIFGGTGFLGRHLVQALASKGYIIRIATRHPQKAYFLKTAGTPGQIVAQYVNYKDEVTLCKAIQGSDVVINLIGVLYEKGKQKFDHVHRLIPAKIAEVCAQYGILQFLHVSALGVDRSKSNYAKSKLAGEEAIRHYMPSATIIRPGLIYGPQDDFFNRFAAMANILPCLPLIGGGKTLFQPVYVCDVAQAMTNACDPRSQSLGQTYELTGEEIYSFKDLMLEMFACTNRPRALVPLPWFAARIKAFFLSILPKPPITQDQITSLKYDNVVSGTHPNLQQLGIDPTIMTSILPLYLSRFSADNTYLYEQ